MKYFYIEHRSKYINAAVVRVYHKTNLVFPDGRSICGYSTYIDHLNCIIGAILQNSTSYERQKIAPIRLNKIATQSYFRKQLESKRKPFVSCSALSICVNCVVKHIHTSSIAFAHSILS